MQTKLQALYKYRHSANLQILAWCTGVAVLWRGGLEIINQTLVPLLTMTPPSPRTSASAIAARASLHGYGHFFKDMDRWLAWDSGWYKVIVTKGYIVPPHLHGQATIAFFPGFPVLVRLIDDIFRTSPTKSGLFINFLLVIGACYFLYKITERMAKQANRSNPVLLARVAVLLLLLNPSSFFFASFYADALLVFCITASLYFALQWSFIWAAVFAGLASATKSTGALLLPVLLVMYVQAYWPEIRNMHVLVRKHLLKLLAICVLSELGILAYMGYLWHRFRQPLAFMKVEKYWNRGQVSILHAPGYIWRTDYRPIPHLVHWWTNLGVFEVYMAAVPIVVLGLVLYIAIWQRKEFAWLGLFSLLVVVAPLTTGQTVSLNRYVLVLTPLFSLIAVYFYGSKHKFLTYAVQAWLWISVLLLVIFTLSFLDLYFMG